MGDRTQILALVLALRYKKPMIVMLGIFIATILNHGLAAILGEWLAGFVPDSYLQVGLAVTFMLFAIWMLIPDNLNLDENQNFKKSNVFWVTCSLFFLAEMGDKTQLVTLALGVNFQNSIVVTLGSTTGMLLADGLVVFTGEKILRKIPMNIIRMFSAVWFFVFGVLLLLF